MEVQRPPPPGAEAQDGWACKDPTRGFRTIKQKNPGQRATMGARGSKQVVRHLPVQQGGKKIALRGGGGDTEAHFPTPPLPPWPP